MTIYQDALWKIKQWAFSIIIDNELENYLAKERIIGSPANKTLKDINWTVVGLDVLELNEKNCVIDVLAFNNAERKKDMRVERIRLFAPDKPNFLEFEELLGKTIHSIVPVLTAKLSGTEGDYMMVHTLKLYKSDSKRKYNITIQPYSTSKQSLYKDLHEGMRLRVPDFKAYAKLRPSRTDELLKNYYPDLKNVNNVYI